MGSEAACLVEFFEELWRPVGLDGPADFFEFSWFALICSSVAIRWVVPTESSIREGVERVGAGAGIGCILLRGLRNVGVLKCCDRRSPAAIPRAQHIRLAVHFSN